MMRFFKPATSRKTFSARSPPKKTVGCQSLEVRVFEATYFVAVITFGQKCECVGQYGSQKSNVFRPNNRSTSFPSRLCITAPASSSAESAGMHMLYLGLKALSQRAIVALSALQATLLIGSAWYLFAVTLPNPTVYQLIGLGGYGVMILLSLLIIGRWR